MQFKKVIVHPVPDDWKMFPEPGEDQYIRRVAITDEDSRR
jgi:hypothetical protein